MIQFCCCLCAPAGAASDLENLLWLDLVVDADCPLLLPDFQLTDLRTDNLRPSILRKLSGFFLPGGVLPHSGHLQRNIFCCDGSKKSPGIQVQRKQGLIDILGLAYESMIVLLCLNKKRNWSAVQFIGQAWDWLDIVLDAFFTNIGGILWQFYNLSIQLKSYSFNMLKGKVKSEILFDDFFITWECSTPFLPFQWASSSYKAAHLHQGCKLKGKHGKHFHLAIYQSWVCYWNPLREWYQGYIIKTFPLCWYYLAIKLTYHCEDILKKVDQESKYHRLNCSCDRNFALHNRWLSARAARWSLQDRKY